MAITDVIEQPRAPGGRFGPKPAADKPLTPLQTIREAEARAARGDFIVPPPVPLAELNRIRPMGSKARPGDEDDFNRNCERQQHLITWLKQTAEAGTPRDLWRSWYAWRPGFPATKLMLRNHFDEQHASCERRFVDLARAAEPELAAIRNHVTRSRIRASLVDKVAKARDALDKALAEQARWERNFAAEEARERESA